MKEETAKKVTRIRPGDGRYLLELDVKPGDFMMMDDSNYQDHIYLALVGEKGLKRDGMFGSKGSVENLVWMHHRPKKEGNSDYYVLHHGVGGLISLSKRFIELGKMKLLNITENFQKTRPMGTVHYVENAIVGEEEIINNLQNTKGFEPYAEYLQSEFRRTMASD